MSLTTTARKSIKTVLTLAFLAGATSLFLLFIVVTIFARIIS